MRLPPSSEKRRRPTAMSTRHTAQSGTDFAIKLSELCRRLDVKQRDVRYVLQHGMVPDGVAEDPGQGNHRTFNAEQAFWLAIVIKLKAAGLKPRQAAEIADWSRRLKGLTRNLNWDWNFSPFDGALHTQQKWVIEVGDGSCVRILTDANPSRRGLQDETGWVSLSSRMQNVEFIPVVTIQVNLSQLARALTK
ncbi:MerR family transcriptional regulator [bacterium]|nr:MerR family transcriptional regulator [bacterium]